jgi:hypothetical protein
MVERIRLARESKAAHPTFAPTLQSRRRLGLDDLPRVPGGSVAD